jgi:hypothetical protein
VTMIHSKRGQLVIFDALLFLSISAVASVGLISSLQSQPQSGHGEFQDFVEAAHAALLGTTIRRAEWEVGVEVSALTAGILGKETLSDSDSTWMGLEIRAILTNLCSPRFEYQWVAEDENGNVTIASDESGATSASDVYVSAVMISAEGAEISFVLRIWQS